MENSPSLPEAKESLIFRINKQLSNKKVSLAILSGFVVVAVVGVALFLYFRSIAPASNIEEVTASAPTGLKEIEYMKVGESTAIRDMYPNFRTNVPSVKSMAFYEHVYEPLVRRDSNLQLTPALAESWTNPDSKTWVFNLRKGVKFHNGKDFSAEDVVYTLELLKKVPKLAILNAGVEKAEAIDPHTVRITTASVDPIFLAKMTTVLIMPKGLGDQLNVNPVGTGPYRFDSILTTIESTKSGAMAYLTINRNDDYYGKKAMVKKVTFYSITNDDKKKYEMLKKGEFDLIDYVPAESIAEVENSKDFALEKSTSGYVVTLFMDQMRDKITRMGDPIDNPFKKLEVRQAIYHAIDVDEVIKKAYKGLAVPADSVIAPSSFGANANIKRLPYDPEKAKSLLVKAGYPDGFDMILDSPHPKLTPGLEIVAEQLNRVGIKAKVVTLVDKDNKRFFAKELPFTTQSWAPESLDGEELLELVFSLPKSANSSVGSDNYSNYSNPKVDELIEKVSNTTDQKVRKELMQQAFKILHDDVAAIPVSIDVVPFAHKKNIVWKPTLTAVIKITDVEGMR